MLLPKNFAGVKTASWKIFPKLEKFEMAVAKLT
jgi:hypothetical protein